MLDGGVCGRRLCGDRLASAVARTGFLVSAIGDGGCGGVDSRLWRVGDLQRADGCVVDGRGGSGGGYGGGGSVEPGDGGLQPLHLGCGARR
jgi:hypothetical protein